jgi:light-dependent protochlorophyllide reductase
MSNIPGPQQTVIITGGNSGLGYQAAKTILEAGSWYVVIASRSPERNAEAVNRLQRETGTTQVRALHLDLASLESVRTFVKVFKQQSDLPPLKGLLCNAGLQTGNPLEYTQDGFELTFGVNHLGHFLLVNLLLDSLAPSARIVMVSSGTHDPATTDGRFNPPHYENAEVLAHPEKAKVKLSGLRRYSTSKLCNLFFTYELDRRLKTDKRSITVNAYDPRAVPGTGLMRYATPTVQRIVNALKPVISLITTVETIENSGRAMARLILEPTLATVSGKYFQVTKAVASSQESYGKVKALELWNSSLRLVNFSS